MLEKGKQVELNIESLAPGGEGVSKDFAVPVFINKAAPGDKLLVEIYDNRRSFAKAQLLQVIAPGKDRIEAPCKLFKVCGGCQWMHLNYEAQLAWKKSVIEQTLRHIGGKEISDLCNEALMPAVPSEKQFGYRNKVNLPVRNPRESKRLLAGYFETNSHRLVNIKHCPIQPELLDAVLEQIKLLAEKYEITAYDEQTAQGLLRHIQMRFSEAEQNVLVTLVVNCSAQKLPGKVKKLAEELMAKISAVIGVCANCNQLKGNRILAEETVSLAGELYIKEVLRTERKDFPVLLQQGLRFQLSPTSFFQVNTAQAVTLLEIIAQEVRTYIENCCPGKVPGRDYAGKSGNGSFRETQPTGACSNVAVLDAYAGVGSIALWLSPFVDKVLAVESNASAVSDGECSLRLNNIDNVEFHLAKLEDFLPLMLKDERTVQIAVLDPPRQGLSQEVIEAIADIKPEMIIYVSCNPATLARDLRIFLTVYGYKVEKIVPVDLFPQTYHIESMTVLRQG